MGAEGLRSDLYLALYVRTSMQKKGVQIEKENIGSENISMGSEDGRRLEAGNLG